MKPAFPNPDPIWFMTFEQEVMQHDETEIETDLIAFLAIGIPAGKQMRILSWYDRIKIHEGMEIVVNRHSLILE